MDVDVRDHGQSRYTVHVSLTEGEVRGAFDRTYQQLSDRGGIKGFRPGKVPRQIIDRNYDYEMIQAATYEYVVQDRLQQALEEHDLRPLDQVDIEQGSPPDEEEELATSIKAGLVDEEETEEVDEDAEEHDHECDEDCDHDHEEIALVEGEPFDFYTTFTAYPRPELPDLSELKLRRPVVEITDEEVDERIEQLQRINAEEVDPDRSTIEEGDVVVVDLKIVLEDEDADEASAQEQEIAIGDRQYIADIDKALVGHESGDTVEVDYTFEDDHPDAEVAGKAARVIAEIDSFSARELPELDDDFARSLGDYSGMDDLRESIREELQTAADREADQELHRQVTRHLIEQTEVELPEEFIDGAAEQGLDDLRGQLQQAGMSLEEFAETSDIDETELLENQRAQAQGSLTLRFALEALAREKDIEVTDEDMAQELQRIAEESGGDLQMVEQAAAVQPNFTDEVQERVMRRKVLDDVVAAAEIEEVPREEYEAEKEAEAATRAAEAEEDGQEEDAADEVDAEDLSGEIDKEEAAETSKESTEAAEDENVRESESQ